MVDERLGVFLPICLHGGSRLQRKDVLDYVLRKHIWPEHDALLVICDDLQAYSWILKDAKQSNRTALRTARKEGDKTQTMARSVVGEHFRRHQRAKIFRWRELATVPGFTAVFERVVALCRNDTDFSRVVDEFVDGYISGLKVNVQRQNVGWEYRYVLSEVAMSCFVTEMLGYNVEMWEETHVYGTSVDPLSYIYEEEPSVAQWICGTRELSRQFRVLDIPPAEEIKQ